MKHISTKFTVLASSVLLAFMAGSTAYADDGQRLSGACPVLRVLPKTRNQKVNTHLYQ